MASIFGKPTTNDMRQIMKNIYSSLVILLTSLLLVACGGGGSAGSADIPIQTDTVAPVITLIGEDTITLEFGDTFTEPGATATDAVDGDLTASMVMTGSVDNSTKGTYTLSYNVKDTAGNPATEVKRVVTVEPETQSANGIWSDDGEDSMFIGLFNEGKFIFGERSVLVDNKGNEVEEGTLSAGTYSIEGDQLETESVKTYVLNGAFISDGSATATVTSASTIFFTGKDGNGVTRREATLIYDSLNNQSVNILDLAGIWKGDVDSTSCFGVINATSPDSCSFSITETGDVLLNTTDCKLEGKISQTTTDSFMTLAASVTGDQCESAGQYTGFTVYLPDDDGGPEGTDELLMIMSNEQFGFVSSIGTEQ